MRAFAALMLVASLLVVVGPAGKAEGCSCASVDPALMLEDADAAFVGTLTRAPDRGDGTQFEGVWVFEADEWVKGDLGPQVGVHSALDGGACGFEMSVGDTAGIFLYNDDGRPTSGLCSMTTPEGLRSASQPLQLDGTGPPTFLVASFTGRARLAVLDASGDLLAAEGDEREGWSVSLCPGSQYLVDVVEADVTVRDASTLETVRTVEPPAEGRPEQVWCADENAERIVATVWSDNGSKAALEMLGQELLYERIPHQVDISDGWMAVVGEPTSDVVDVVDLSSGEVTPIDTGPGDMATMRLRPDGERLLIAKSDFPPAGGFTTRVLIYDTASGEPTWESEPLPDTEIYGWIDDTTLAGGVYPTEADAPQTVEIDTETGTISQVELRGGDFFRVGDSIASINEGDLYVTRPDGEPAVLASLPSPEHRLIGTLDPDAEIEAGAAVTSTAPIQPTVPNRPAAGPGVLWFRAIVGVISLASLVAWLHARQRLD